MALMREVLEDLGFDAHLDKAGNAVGVLERGDGPTVMLNGHLDTVPYGDPDEWAHPPLSGAVADGHLWGRGSVDMKSALACMAFAAKDAVEQGFQGKTGRDGSRTRGNWRAGRTAPQRVR